MTIASEVLACAEYGLTPAGQTKGIKVKDRAAWADKKSACAKYNIAQGHMSQSKWAEATELAQVYLHSTSLGLLL